jgi:hypothetical protein
VWPCYSLHGARLRDRPKGPETISDLGAGVPTGTLTVFPGCAGLLIGFADKLIDEAILP